MASGEAITLIIVGGLVSVGTGVMGAMNAEVETYLPPKRQVSRQYRSKNGTMKTTSYVMRPGKQTRYIYPEWMSIGIIIGMGIMAVGSAL